MARRPQSLALVDPLDRMRVTGHAPRRLTYRQTNRAVSALAGRFIDAGLKPGAVIAAQLPNTVEAMITVLAALRAGLVIAPLPRLWRLSELSEALNRIKAQVLVTMARIDGFHHSELARRAAANTLSVKYVAAFGEELPENVASLDDTIQTPFGHTVEESYLQTQHKFPEQDSQRGPNYLRRDARGLADRSAHSGPAQRRRIGDHAGNPSGAWRTPALRGDAFNIRRALRFTAYLASEMAVRWCCIIPSMRKR